MSERHNDQSVRCARRDFLKTTGVVVVGFSIADKVAAQAPAVERLAVQRGLVSGPPDPDAGRFLHRDSSRQHGDDLLGLRRARPGRAHRAAASCGRGTGPRPGTGEDVRVDTFVSTNGFTAASRTAAIGGTETPRGGRRGASRAARAGVGAAEGSRSGSDRRQRRRVGAQRSAALRHVRRAGRGQTVQPQVRAGRPTTAASSFRARAPTTRSRSGATTTASSARAFRGRTSPRRSAAPIEYVQHVRLPGMLHGRVVWPRGQGAHGISNPTVVSIDESSIKDIPGRPDRSPAQLRRRGGGARVGCRPRGEAVEGHLGAVRAGASRSRGLVRQLQVGQDERLDRHQHRRRGRRAVARRARPLRDLSRTVPVARDDGAELRGRGRHARTVPS